ncbi:MAG TPA: GNAT family N-acetyltransferase [Frankiaceae bacterium]|nr:GNAT family N-acetyltransferase [Frankiaceae bacterium]
MTARTSSPRRATVIVPADRLPADEAERDATLQHYFAEWVPHADRVDSEWRVELRPPPRAGYYVDPRLRDGLTWWSSVAGRTAIRDVLLTRKRIGGMQVSLSDAWSAFAWSTFLSRDASDETTPLTVLHVDDHQDLMSPRLVCDDGGLRDLITGGVVAVDRPATVRAAIESGAIGMGSFIVPFLTARAPVHLRHVRMPSGREHSPGSYRMVLVDEPDSLIAPGSARPAVSLRDSGARRSQSGTDVGTYRLQESLDGWVDDLPDGQVLLHIDCDYFNNRYDCDSDWRSHDRTHDPDARAVAQHVDELCAVLQPVMPRVADITVALSPGFFPAELWQPTVETLVGQLGGRRRQHRQPDAVEGPVRLEEGHGTRTHGGGPGGAFWHIYQGRTRAGSVWINRIDHPSIGEHHSLSIELNRTSRGRGVGREAYRLAAEASGHDELWLHMRKSNIASRRAAEHAGFAVVDVPGERQLVMRWRRRNAGRRPR